MPSKIQGGYAPFFAVFRIITKAYRAIANAAPAYTTKVAAGGRKPIKAKATPKKPMVT